MSYSLNPYLPKVRAKAIGMVKSGKSLRLVSRYLGVNASTVSRWLKKSRLNNSADLPTLSSRPKRPKKISPEIAAEIVCLRADRTIGGIVKELAGRGVKISLSSVKRIIKSLKCKSQNAK